MQRPHTIREGVLRVEPSVDHPQLFPPSAQSCSEQTCGDDAAQINVSHANYDEITVTTAMKLGTTTVLKTPTVSNIRK